MTNSEQNGTITQIEQEDFYSGENRTVLLRLNINPKKKGKLSLGQLEISYKDVESKKQLTFKKKLSVVVTSDKEKVSRSENEDVTVEATLIEADKLHEESIKMFENGDRAGAQTNFSNLQQMLTERNVKLSNVIIEKKIEALQMESEQMDEAELSIGAMSTYLKSSKSRMYNSKKGKRTAAVQQVGSKGLDVERLQQALKYKGLYSGDVDGNFSNEVTESVKEFQKKESLSPDGIAGPRTLKALGIY